MANIQATEERLGPGVITYTWGPCAQGDTPLPVLVPLSHSDKSIQVYGTPGAGLAVDPQGTLDSTFPGGSGFSSLRNPAGTKLNTLLVTASLPDTQEILENTQQVKPVLSGGDGTTSITIKLRCTTQARR